jgi:hypothetical protein
VSRVGVQTDVVIADIEDAQAIADSGTPTSDWQGFTYNGFHNVQLCTLLSLLKTNRPDTEFDKFLNLIECVSVPTGEGPLVYAIKPEQVAELAPVARLDDPEFETLASSWHSTEEFVGWSNSDVQELLRELGDLAGSALLQGKCLMIWQSL